MSKNNATEQLSLIKKAILALVTIIFLLVGAQAIRRVATR